mgnify:CR=1 FL=1
MPSCVSQGRTIEELSGNVHEAIQAVSQEEVTEAGQIAMLLPWSHTSH